MTRTIPPGALHGEVDIPASKSQAHRLLICAALSFAPVTLRCDGISQDIAATVRCLRALGAEITDEDSALHIAPITAISGKACQLYCGESGSTLRFLLPLVGALGASAVFHMEGRLPTRPLAPLDAELRAHGMTLRQDGALLYCEGRLQNGAFTLPGNISSQYISGLLFALPLLSGESTLTVTGTVESGGYLAMTQDALRRAGVTVRPSESGFVVPGGQQYHLPAHGAVEGDYSSAAFFLCAGAFSARGVTVRGLAPDSAQGDRAVVALLRQFGAAVTQEGDCVTVKKGALRSISIDASEIPDLVPVLSVVAAVADGETRITHAGRLRLKESDRLRTVTEMLRALGADVDELPDGLVIRGRPALSGGAVSACGDHRIAMSAAVAACVCDAPVTLSGSETVAKSYPRFWENYAALKGALL